MRASLSADKIAATGADISNLLPAGAKPSHLSAVPAAAPDVSARYLDHLKTVNTTFYDQIKVVDQKAAYIFTFLIALMTLSEQLRDHIGRALHPEPPLQWLLSLCLALSLATVAVCTILVVVPRNRRGGSSLYWGAWPKAGERMAEMRFAQDGAALAEEYRTNIENLAAICRQKYRLVRCSYLSVLAALIAAVLVVAAG